MRHLILILVFLCLAATGFAQVNSFPYTVGETSPSTDALPTPIRAEMRTRDGVLLVADVWLPAGAGPWPVILVRTPYLRATAAQALGANYWTARGYAFIAQDVRGKGDSGGTFVPWENEAADGFDTIAWAAEQKWSNGRVGMFGGSYLGAVQWAAASLQPPALKALVILPAISDPFFGGPYDFGVPSLSPFWAYENSLQRPRDPPETNAAEFSTLPLERVDDALFHTNVPIWDTYIARPNRSQWNTPRWPQDVCRVQAPTLMFIAIWDGDGIGPILNWESIQGCHPGKNALVVGPWPHSMSQNGRRGDAIYGDGAKVSILQIAEPWMKARLNDSSSPVPTARVFVTGENNWRTFESWPPLNREQRYYLTTVGTKPSLSEAPSVRQTSLPLRQSGSVGLTRTLRDAVFADRTVLPSAELRDQIVFVTNPFTVPTVLGGSPRLRLTMQAGAEDADVFAFIVAVAPSGEMRVLTHPGKLRLSYRNGFDAPRTPLTLGQDVIFDLRLWDFAHRFQPGERLGIAIRTEWFPRWARNTGAGPLLGAVKPLRANHLLRVGKGDRAMLTISRLD